MNKQTVKFLDYEISNTGNGDGWVLMKAGTSMKNLWECHLGNYTNVESAKKDAVLQFMIARPAIFHSTILYRMNGMNGQYHEYFLFKNAVEKEGLEMPDEIGHSNEGNYSLKFSGKNLKGYSNK